MIKTELLAGAHRRCYGLSKSQAVVLSDRCTFRFRSYQSSHGLASSLLDLAQAHRELVRFLDSDPIIQNFRSIRSAKWRYLKEIFRPDDPGNIPREMARYVSEKADPSSMVKWSKAAFAMPFIRAYYKGRHKVF